MSSKAYKTSIPPNATEVIESRYSDGAKKSASYVVAGEKVGFREWLEDGSLEYEYAYRNEKRHGRIYYFYPNGQPAEVQPYRNGFLHGIGKQWSEDGRVLVTWTLVNGVGLDLWCDNTTEKLSEEAYWPGEGEAGYSRQWNGDEKTISDEYYFSKGSGYHGVWREWNAGGRLRRGFPKFFVNDKKVSKRQYLQACKTDPTLPAYRTEDDEPRRRLPKEYVAQRKKRR